MKRIGTKLSITLFGVVVLFAAESTSFAQYPYRAVRRSIYGGGYVTNRVIVTTPSVGVLYGGTFAPTIGVYGPTWHDTSHLDYHPGYIEQHGNHFHAVPGHYHVHRSGHWH